MKRSVSPQLVDPAAPKKRRVFSVLQALKSVFSRPNQQPPTPAKEPTLRIQDSLPGPRMPHRHRMSIDESIHKMRQSVPRSSILAPSGYVSVLSNLQAHAEGANNDEAGRLGPDAEASLQREVSPSVYVPQNHVLPTNPRDLVLAESPDTPTEEWDQDGEWERPPYIALDPKERYHMLQLKRQIETSDYLQQRLRHMVDPDETTSVLRPNNKVDCTTQTYTKMQLDRTLHFNALRTKLALKNRKNVRGRRPAGVFSGEFLYDLVSETPEQAPLVLELSRLSDVYAPTFANKTQPRPQELHLHDDDSRQRPSRRDRDMAHRADDANGLDADFVERSRNVSSLLKMKDQPEPKKLSVGPGAGFTFNLDKSRVQPFLGVSDSSAGTPTDTSVQSSAPGNTNATDAGQKPAFSFGEKPKPDIPVSAFSFGSNTTQTPKFSLGKAPGQDSTNDEGPAKKRSLFDKADGSETLGNGTLFGSKPAELPKFSLGNSKPASDETPKFSFGGYKPASEETPKFSFGGSKPVSGDTPKFSFGGLSSDAKKPLTLFGGKAADSTLGLESATLLFANSDKKLEAPKFSFGSSLSKPNTKSPTSTDEKTSKPLFGQGLENPTASLFSFDKDDKDDKDKKEDSRETPKFSFGKTDPPAAPKFSFGKTDSPATPTFNFGKTESPSAPAFSFGSKPAETSSGSEGAKEASAVKSAFSFGASKPDTVKADAPKFSFGNKAASAEPLAVSGSAEALLEQAPVPSFSFGAGGSSNFSFGSKTETDKASTTSPAPAPESLTNKAQDSTKEAEKKATPAFSFGDAKSTQSSAPSFSFGNSTTPAFTFGKTPTPAPEGTKEADKPAFLFGKPTDAASNKASEAFPQKSTTPFGLAETPFGQKSTAPFGQPTPSTAALQTAPGTSVPAFSFGQSATADPALIFGSNSAAPAFNFSVGALKPATPVQPLSNTPPASGGFSFSSKAIPAFGGSRPTTPSTLGFGQTGAPNFGGQAASVPASVFGQSRSVTPNAPFGAANGMPNNAPNSMPAFGSNQVGNPMQNQMLHLMPGATNAGFGFGGGNGNGAPFGGPGTIPSFGSTGNVPSFGSGSGGFGQASREHTPPAFGLLPQMGQQPFTPPVGNIAPRKIAQMRQRKR